ncbi:hypothetical protein L218DRAFT_984111 [Marasmius fiardii PR-910]|nr:hypothetical protein L218DRAFT_984111 [Marasmius fiardii PR-910]
MPVPLRANVNHKVYNVVTDFANFDLHSAAASGNQGLVEYALARGQPINSVIDGVLPLHAACAGGHEQVVKVLIDHGADVNAPRLPRRYSNEKTTTTAPIQGTTGSTPLHFAAANGNKNVMMTLLLRGAHPDIQDKHGITPAALAEQHGWVECAALLSEWIKNKDSDLRERETGAGGADEFGQNTVTLGNREKDHSLWNEEDATGSLRKRIQVKRSIDTALNKFKPSGGLGAPQKITPATSSSTSRLPSHTPPTSPTRQRRDPSPSPSEGSHHSDSFDPGRRRPSLPQVLNPSAPSSSNHPLRNYKSATLVKAPQSPRRPRSAGNGAEPEADTSSIKTPTRKLGPKLSLLNLFKKGGDCGGIPLERTSSNQVSSSSSMPISVPSSQVSSSWNISSLSNSPKQISLLETKPSGPLPRSGYRFGSSDASSRQDSPSMSSSSIPQISPQNVRSSPQPFTSPRHTGPLAVDLHNALAAQQHQTQSRARSGSNGSAMGLGITFDGPGTEDGGASLSGSPLNRIAMHRMRPGHVRDRSGSGASNRNIQVFDDDVIIPDPSNSKGNSRPGILRGHHRTSSTGQGSVLRALRFDSSSSTSSRRDREGDQPPLRGCTSASSLRRAVDPSPNRRLASTPTRVPDSAPPTMGDFESTPGDRSGDDRFDDADESYYGQPLEPRTMSSHLNGSSQMRNRGSSFASSDSSLSPVLSPADVGVVATSTLNSDFPFSINRPPPMLDDTGVDGAITGSRLLRVPPDGRGRGDSVSSTSTTDSAHNPALSVSTTSSASGGSATITTPLRSPEDTSFLELESPKSPNYDTISHTMVQGYGQSANTNMGVTLNERRSRSPLGIDMSLAASHARAERLVQQKKADILTAHDADLSDGDGGQVPLSARLAALGESLELERMLREQKQAEEKKVASGTPPKAVRLLRDSLDTVTTSTSGPGVIRQSSLNTGSSPRKKEPKRPHTSSGTSSPTTPDAISSLVITSKVEKTKPNHHLSHSTSAVEISPILDPNLINSTRARSLTPDLADLDSNLSRMSSLEGDTDTDLGPSLYRINTAPHSSSTKSRRERDLASATKLTRMGITPNAPTPPKRFGGLRSLVQTLKGR